MLLSTDYFSSYMYTFMLYKVPEFAVVEAVC
jgi:hypothetical protein